MVDRDFIQNLWIEKVPTNEKINIYINIPFCYSQCRYCLYQGNLNSYEYRAKYFEDYLIPNISYYTDLFKRYEINCIYIGGGTPNTMPIEYFIRLKYIMGNLWDKAKTRIIEINPAYADIAWLKELTELNFTLITFGIQTFDKDTLIRMKRRYVSPDDVHKLINVIRDNNITKYISLDIMAYIQSYSISDLTNYLTQDIERALVLDVDFITVYPELNLINVDNKAAQTFANFIKAYKYDGCYSDISEQLEVNPRLIVRFIKDKYDYNFFYNNILNYYADDFPTATINVIGFGDLNSKHEVFSYSPDRFLYIERYQENKIPEYDILYYK